MSDVHIEVDKWSDVTCPETQLHIIEPGEIQWQTILVHHSPAVVKAHGWLKYLWGLDIFFGPIPFGKTLLLLNLIVWYLLKGV